MNKDKNLNYASFTREKGTQVVDGLSRQNMPTRKIIKICDQIPVSDGFPSFFNPAEVSYASMSSHHAGIEDGPEDRDKTARKILHEKN